MARVLVIDDEKNIRKMVRLTLERAGHGVETAAEGKQGMDLFRTGAEWDVTLTDERLPDMKGRDIVREVRRRAPLARIIMMTSFATVDLAAEVLGAGAADLLRKPFSTDLLRSAVEATLARPRQLLDQSQTVAPQGVAPPRSNIDYLINGFRFWPAKIPPTTPSLPGFEARRAFHIVKPSEELSEQGEPTLCVVGITPHVRELVEQETGQEFLDDAPLWDTICRRALSNALWERREMPPSVLPVYEFTPAQIYVARQMAGMPFLMV